MSVFKHKFEEKVEGLLEQKNDNAIIPTLEKRDYWIKILLEENKTILYYNLKKRFEILRVGQQDRLIKKRKGAEEEFKFVLALEELHPLRIAED